MLSVSLAAFCSYGSCGDEDAEQRIDGAMSNPLHHASASSHIGDDIFTNFQDEASILSDFYDKITEIAKCLDMSRNEDPVLESFRHAFNITGLAAGVLELDIEQLQNMKGLAVRARGDTASPSQRVMLDNLYQTSVSCIDTVANTTIGDIPLFTGGSGDSCRLGTLDASGTGFGTDNISADFEFHGFIAGGVDSANVYTSGGNSGLVTLVVGGQSFQGTMPMGTVGSVQLTSITDCANSIAFDITGTGLTTTEGVQKELNTLSQLDIGSPISMRSASADLSAVITNIETKATTLPRIYGLSYGYDPIASLVTYKLSNGLNVWETAYDANSVPAARIVPFDNGLTITIAADSDETKPLPGVEIINVESGNQVTLPFKVGTAEDDVIDIQFKPATALDLNLSRTNILDRNSATASADAIDTAIIDVVYMIIKLAGTQGQLNCAKQVYELQRQFSEMSDESNTTPFSIELLNLSIKQLDAMQHRAAQSNGDDVGPLQRAMLNDEFQARLGNIDRISSKIPYAEIATAGVPMDFASIISLNLTGTNVLIKTSAEMAFASIDAARAKLSDMIAQLKGE